MEETSLKSDVNRYAGIIALKSVVVRHPGCSLMVLYMVFSKKGF